MVRRLAVLRPDQRHGHGGQVKPARGGQLDDLLRRVGVRMRFPWCAEAVVIPCGTTRTGARGVPTVAWPSNEGAGTSSQMVCRLLRLLAGWSAAYVDGFRSGSQGPVPHVGAQCAVLVGVPTSVGSGSRCFSAGREALSIPESLRSAPRLLKLRADCRLKSGLRRFSLATERSFFHRVAPCLGAHRCVFADGMPTPAAARGQT
jgi:hypothetical protein